MDTREIILETAFLGFLEEGFDSISLNELIKRTNLTKGAFYYHFKSKDELLSEIVNKYFHTYIDGYLNQSIVPEGNAFDKLNFMIESIANIQTKMVLCKNIKIDPRAFYILFLSGLKRDSKLRKHNEKISKKMNEALSIIIKQGQDEGHIRRDISTKKIVNLINACVKGTMFEWTIGYGIDLQYTLKENVEALIEAIKS